MECFVLRLDVLEELHYICDTIGGGFKSLDKNILSLIPMEA